jgi:hypothetical protein
MYTKALSTVRSLYKCTEGGSRPRNCLPQKPYGLPTWQGMSPGKALHFKRSTAENGKAVGGLGPERMAFVHRCVWLSDALTH